MLHLLQPGEDAAVLRLAGTLRAYKVADDATALSVVLQSDKAAGTHDASTTAAPTLSPKTCSSRSGFLNIAASKMSATRLRDA